MNHRLPRCRAAALLLVLSVSGCGMFKKVVVPPCPPVSVLEDAANLVRYQEGQGRDIIDVLFEAKVADFKGECEYNKTRTRVTLDLAIDFTLLRGPANLDRAARFAYFVAIPAFHPAPQGKRIFRLAVTFPAKRSRMRIRDEIQIEIPIGRGRAGTDYAVYLGLQLSPGELDANRQRVRP
jgi:hypothetical protein